MDVWLQRMYERHGARYPVGASVLGMAVSLVVVIPLFALFPVQYLSMGFEGWAKITLWGSVAGVVGLAVLAWSANRWSEMAAWSDGGRTRELAATSNEWAFSGPRRSYHRAVAVTFAVGGPLIAVESLSYLTAPKAVDYIELSLGCVVGGLAAWSFAYPVFEIVLRPVRTSLSGYSEAPASASLSSRLLLIVIPLVYAWMIAAGFMFTERGAEGGDLLIVYAAALVPSGLLTLALLLWLSTAVLGPISDLASGQSSVASGRLDTTVPVSAGDELGDLARGFNEMVAGLRDREGLRDRNAALIEELRESRTRIVAAGDESRRRVERDLHDGAQQSLVLLNLKLGLAERKVAENPGAAEALLVEARGDLEGALAELRDLAHGIYPQVLTSDGLAGALTEVAGNTGLPVEISTDGVGRYPAEIEAAVYFCCLEALQNAVKHAGEGAAGDDHADPHGRRAPLRGRRRRSRVRRRRDAGIHRPPEHGRPDRGAGRRARRRVGARDGHQGHRNSPGRGLTWTLGFSGCMSGTAPATYGALWF